MIELRNMMLGEILTCSANLAEQFINDRLELWLSDEDRDRARIALTSAGVKGKDLLVAIAPGAGHPKRLWPLRRFVDLGCFLQQEWGARLLIIGGPEDRKRALQLQANLGTAAVSFAGEMTLDKPPLYWSTCH